MKRRLASILVAPAILLGIAFASAPSASTSAPARPAAASTALAPVYCNSSPQAWQWSGTQKFGRGWCIHDEFGWALYFQPGDGNFVLYDYWGKPRWQAGVRADHGFAQSDGNFVLTDVYNHVLYQSHTCCYSLASGQLYDAVAIGKGVGTPSVLYHYGQIYIVNASTGRAVTYLGQFHPPIAQ